MTVCTFCIKLNLNKKKIIIYMLIFHIQFTIQFYIKNYMDNYFFSDYSDNKNWILNPACEEYRTDYIPTIHPNGGLIIKSAVSNQVLEIGENNVLNYYPLSGNDYQIFSFVLIGPKTFVIRNMGYCIEYVPELKIYKSAECSGNDCQKFVVITKEDEDVANTIGCITEKLYNEFEDDEESSEESSHIELHDHSHIHAHGISSGHSHIKAHNHLDDHPHDHFHSHPHKKPHDHPQNHSHYHPHKNPHDYPHNHSHYHPHNHSHYHPQNHLNILQSKDHLNSPIGYSYDPFGNIIRYNHSPDFHNQFDDLNDILPNHELTDNHSPNGIHQYNPDTSERISDPNHPNNYGNIIGYGYLNGDFYNHYDKNVTGGYSGTPLKYILGNNKKPNMLNLNEYYTGLHNVGKKYRKNGNLYDYVANTLKI